MKSDFSNKFDKIELPENTETRDTLMARLIGLLLTDGGVSQISGKRWKVHFTSSSEMLSIEFGGLMKQLFHLSSRPVKMKGAFYTSIWISRQACDELHSYSKSFRKLAYDKPSGSYPEAIIPRFVMENENLAKEFLRYAFSGDGTVTFYIGKARYGFRFDRCVKLYCEHPTLRLQYFELLKKLNYKPTMWKGSIILRKLENLTKFRNEINFAENVKISGNGLWKDISKSDLLRFCVSSYKLKPSQLGKTKKEIHSNLIKILTSKAGTQTI